MTAPTGIIGTDMRKETMGRISDGATIAGITLFGIAAADIQMWLTMIATVMGIIATGFTIWFHVSRLLKERRK